MTAVARRYARAAWLAATGKDGSGMSALVSGLTTFLKAQNEIGELRELMTNPALREPRAALLRKLFEKLDIRGEAVRVIEVLAERDRIHLLPAILDEARRLGEEAEGRLQAEVVCAEALSDSQQARIQKALEKKLGKTIHMSVKVQPEVLGGLLCRVGDWTFDSTVRRHMNILKERLLGLNH